MAAHWAKCFAQQWCSWMGAKEGGAVAGEGSGMGCGSKGRPIAPGLLAFVRRGEEAV